MKNFLFLLIAAFPFTLRAQTGVGTNIPVANDFMYDALGRRIPFGANYIMHGSPFFGDEHCTADLKVRNSKTLVGVKTRVNLENNAVLYLDSAGVELESSVAIDRIAFYDCTDPSKNKILVSGLPPVDKQDESNFYVLLDSGRISLLRFTQVTFYDKQSNYGSAGIIRTFHQGDIYYAHTRSGLVKFAKEEDDVLQVLGNKRAAISSYIAKNNLKCRREADLVKVFAYYNSLP